ncbi:MAG: Rrf2 family transcriptional regulator [Bifidobacterium sp.]|nr:Rrf2 family transcriptional regulator [Bifidobacterium sp.]
MRVSSRFPIAVHTLLCIAHFGGERKVTSNFIAASVNVNAVVIRNILGQLKAAGLVRVDAGVGGAHLARPLANITLLDVFRAVEGDDREMFGFHDNPNPECPVGANIHTLLDGRLATAQRAFEDSLASTTLADLNGQLDVLTGTPTNPQQA